MYPLKFTPILKERLWGGRNLSQFGKRLPENKLIGESWEISSVEDNVSRVRNGNLKGNNINELIEVYMGDLVGDAVYERFGEEFPLLIKFLDAQQRLSVQVHPDDKVAMERHYAYGKNELWYVIDAAEGACIYWGFNRHYTKEEYLEHLENGSIETMLRKVPVQKGEAYFIPAGTVHALGEGIIVAEIQQTSDVTYRIFDWNRVDEQGNERELHTDLALDVIDFSKTEPEIIRPNPDSDCTTEVKSCRHFTINLLNVQRVMKRTSIQIDSFMVYMCVEGSVTLETDRGVEKLKAGETLLVPANIDEVLIKGEGRLLEIYIK
jgi:mannose-6-phosphate isomerase